MSKRKPTAIKILEGTYRKDRAVDNEMSPDLLEDIPEPPDVLGDDEKELWKMIVGECIRYKIYSNLDLFATARYVKRIIQWWDIEFEIDENGYTNKHDQISPLVTRQKQIESYLKWFESEYGFTPSARTGIASHKPSDEDTYKSRKGKDFLNK